MTRGIAIALLLAGSLAARAEPLPPRLTGSWQGTAQGKPGAPKQTLELYLDADGVGMLIGSVEAIPAPGTVIQPGAPVPRAVVGFPVRATIDGPTLRLHIFFPDTMPGAAAQAAKVGPRSCRYDEASVVLTCEGTAMSRRSESLPDDAARMIGQVRAYAPQP